MGDEKSDQAELIEIFKQDFYHYLQQSREMMIDNEETNDEYPLLGYHIQRTESENNIWDIVNKREEGVVLINSIDVSQFNTAQSLANELAKIAGVDFEKDDPDMSGTESESRAFR